jgi:ribose/xylose/arabinose/galactoside ABC-type transport system permease subunit
MAAERGTTLRWAIAAWALLLLFNALSTPGFFTIGLRDGRLHGVLIDILNHGSRIGIIALGMTLVIATGGVDLAVGSTAAIAGATIATLSAHVGWPWWAALGAGLGAGAACGALGAALIALLGLQPIVATLVLMVAGRGAAQIITGGGGVPITDPALIALGNGAWLGLPASFWLLTITLGAFTLVMRATALGLFASAVGASRPAARLAGVPDRRVLVAVYALCGLSAALAGALEMAYIRAGDPSTAGLGLELDAILAAVIGGTSLSGARFSLPGAIAGAMFLQTLSATLSAQNVSSDVAPAPKALVVLAVCAVQSPRLRARLRRRGRP